MLNNAITQSIRMLNYAITQSIRMLRFNHSEHIIPFVHAKDFNCEQNFMVMGVTCYIAMINKYNPEQFLNTCIGDRNKTLTLKLKISKIIY
jgi:hypothetical protein